MDQKEKEHLAEEYFATKRKGPFQEPEVKNAFLELFWQGSSRDYIAHKMSADLKRDITSSMVAAVRENLKKYLEQHGVTGLRQKKRVKQFLDPLALVSGSGRPPKMVGSVPGSGGDPGGFFTKLPTKPLPPEDKDVDPILLDGKPATLLTITDQMCHWPIGDALEGGFHFCGRRGKPYCEAHARKAHQPSAKERRERRPRV